MKLEGKHMKDGIDIGKFADNGKDPFADELPKNQYVKICEDSETATCTICRVDAATGTVKSEQTFAIPKDYDAYRSMCEVGAAHEMREFIQEMLEVFERECCISCSRCHELRDKGAALLKKARGEE